MNINENVEIVEKLILIKATRVDGMGSLCKKSYLHVETLVSTEGTKSTTSHTENILVNEEECQYMVNNKTCIGEGSYMEKMACDLSGTCVHNPNIEY